MLILVMSMVSATQFIDKTVFVTKTDQQIKNYMFNSVTKSASITDTKMGVQRVYYDIKVIKPYNDTAYLIKPIRIRTSLPIKHIQYCFGLYSHSVCRTHLAYNTNTPYWIGEYDEDGTTKITHQTIYQQLIKTARKHFTRAKNYRDEAIVDMKEMGDGLETIPSITI